MKELLNNIDNVEHDDKTKEDRIIDFIKSYVAVEEEIKPLKEHLKDLKKSYVDNDWLSKEEIKIAIKAFKCLKKDEDIEQLKDFYNTIKKETGLNE